MKILIVDLSPNTIHGEVLKNSLKDAEYIKSEKQTDEILKLVKKLQADSDLKAFILAKNSALPFMLAAKHKDIVVAEITDAHSSFMTLGHNNSNILSLSTRILTPDNLLDIVQNYVRSEFEAGRHMVRVNMMNDLLTKEGE